MSTFCRLGRQRWASALTIATLALLTFPTDSLAVVRTAVARAAWVPAAQSPSLAPQPKTVLGVAPKNASSKHMASLATPSAPSCRNFTVAGGSALSAAITTASGGTPMAWGADYLQPTSTTQQLGDYLPRSVPGPTSAVTVSSMDQNVLFLINGTVWGWGTNQRGQLGTGDTAGRNVASQAVGVNGIVAISSGVWHSLALKSDGTLWAWGDDTYGELGFPPPLPNNQSTVPLKVGFSFPAPIVQIAAGEGTSLALDSNGAVWAWGSPLGQGFSVNATPTAVAFAGNPTIVLIALGWDQALAVDSTGNLWSWGGNGQGQLGNGTNTSSTTPAIVTSISGIAAIAAGELFSLATDNTGRVWAWGYNASGQLGIGNQTTPQKSPVQVSSISGPVALAAGGDQAFALFSSGTLYGWGGDSSGEVGTGVATQSYLTPQLVQISGVAQPATCAGPPPTGTGPNPGPTALETLGGHPIDEKPVTCTCGHYPVDAATGNFWHSYTDISIPGRGLSIQFQRTYNSLQAAQSGPLGFGWTHSYNVFLTFDGSGNPTVHEENAATLQFTLNGSSYSAPTRVLAFLVKNGDGTFTLTRQDKSLMVFTSAGLLSKEIDRNGYATSLSYNANQLVSVSDSANRQIVLSYNTSGQLASIADPVNRIASYTYDAGGNLQTVTDLNGGITKFTYDPNHFLLTMTDPRNGVLTNVYDASGRVTQQTDMMNNVTKFTYQTGSTVVTYPNGSQSLEIFQNNGLATRVDGYGTGLATNTAYSYDSATMSIASITDSLGESGNATWDASGNLLTATSPGHQTTIYTYNSLNEPLTLSDPLRVKTTNTFDAKGNLLSTSTPLAGTTSNAVTTYAYDPVRPGDLVTVTDPDGKVWNYTYDTYGNRIKSADPLGNATTYAYDVVGRNTSVVSPNGNVTGGNPALYTSSYTFDGFGDVLTVSDPLGDVTTYTYDGNQNRTSVKDANQHTTTYSFDADNREMQETRPDNSTLKTSYDSNGNVVSQTDGLTNVVSYTYDALDRGASMTDGLGRTTLYGYTGAGLLFSSSDPQGRVTTNLYDSTGRLAGIIYSDASTPNVSFAYDAEGQRTSMTDGTGTSTFTYDSLHRLVKAVNGAGSTVSYGYDLKGQLTMITYPGGTNKVTRTFDPAGRISSILDWKGNTTSFTYDADSNLTTWKFPNTTVGTWTYDRSDNVAAIKYTTGSKNSVFLSLAYSRDGAHQLTADNSQSYGYDTLNRTISAPPSAYSYDSADQLTQIAVTGGTTTSLAYDAGNQLNTYTVMSGATQTQKYTYSYDPNGDRIKRVDQAGNTINLSFNQANRLTRYSTTTTYAYNGDGLRTSKTVSGVSEGYSWNLAESIPSVIVDGSKSYVTGPKGVPLEQIAGNTVSYYHADQLGSIRAITDTHGGTLNTYNYGVWGNVTSKTGTLVNPFQFSSQYLDSESGFYYLRARYYDPSTSQFISRDPKVSETRHGYTYASDRPLNVTDPTGLYDYVYDFYIGEVAQIGSAEAVMAYFQEHMRDIFPFYTGQCDTVQKGESCDLSANPGGYTLGWLPAPNPWPVKVTDVTCTSFTLTALPGHPDYDPNYPGTVTFSTYEQDGGVYLRQTAHSVSHWWDPIATFQAAQAWNQMAENLRAALVPGYTPPPVGITT